MGYEDMFFGAVILLLLLVSVCRLCYVAGRNAGNRKALRIEKGVLKALDSLPFLHGQNSHTLTLSSIQNTLRGALDPTRIKWPRA